MAKPRAARSRISVKISALVPTSTPRVGSKNSRIRASVASSLASTTFCWLPPDSVPASCSVELDLDLQLRHRLVDQLALGLLIDDPARRRRASMH